MIRRLYVRIRGEESGFTLVELMVAIGVILVSLLALAYTAGLAFTDEALARQRQSATGLASQAIEQARALPFDTLAKGLSSNPASDGTISTDPAITTCGTDKCYNGEPIPQSNYSAGTVIKPLVPHTQTFTVGPTAYTVKTYVTFYQGNKTSNTFRVTAVVTWTATERATASHTTQIQSVFYSPTGCLSTATHPFSAPCQPFLYGTAASDSGHVDITGSIQTVANFDRATVWLPADDSDQQIEQTASVHGFAYTGGVSIVYPGNPEVFQGKNQQTSGADNDPASPNNDYSAPAPYTQGSPPAIVNSGALGSLTLNASAGDTTSTVSTTSAGAAHTCLNSAGLNQTDGQPCGNGTQQQRGTLSAAFDVVAGVSDLGPATLVQIGPAGTPGYAYTNRDIAPQPTSCTTTTKDGCVHAEATRTLGTITLATLPANVGAPPSTCGSPAVAPCGWAGYLVRVTGVNDSGSAEAGMGSSGPTVSASGTLSYFNGTGYTTCPLYGAGACAVDASGNLTIPELLLSDPLHPGVTIDITPKLTRGATSVSDNLLTCTPACPNTRSDAKAQSTSPIGGSIHYVVTMGVSLADLTMKVNLGTLLAKASYQQAPSGA
jgi:prepilin-type N-terminal cleavage/methylation domain-containing protein